MTEKNYVVNVKTKIGTIFTVRADTAEELNTNITEVINYSVHDSVAALEELLTGITATPASPVDTVLAAVGGEVISTTPTAFTPVPPPAVAQTAVGARMCSHGPMIARKGQGAKGEWKGLFCPTPKGTAGQCEPKWLNRSDSEWATI